MKGIGTNKRYPIRCMQKCYADLGIQQGELPIAEEIRCYRELSLPMYYGITDEQVQYVIDTINNFR